MPTGDHRTNSQILRRSFNDGIDAIKVDVIQTVGGGGGGGGGTEYTQGNVSSANPVGPITQVVAKSTPTQPASVVDADNITLQATLKGELYVKHVDSLAVTGTFWQATQPISASSLPLPTGAATETTLSAIDTKLAGTAKVKIWDGTNVADIFSLTNSNAVSVAIVDATGDQVTSFGGGVQYQEADVDTSITGTAILWEDSGDTLRAVSAAKPLPVSAASLPLPTGASTESTLSAMSGKLPASLGQKTAANSMSVVLASDQGSVAVTGTFWQATQPISASSLPLPTGAATAAKQPALGVAGTASSDVITVQGIASMTALKVDGSAVTQPISASSLPLPTGAATESTLSTISTNVQKQPRNTSGSQTTSTVDGTAATLTAPANAVGFLLQASDANTANMRWRVGATATASVGQQLQAGRDTGFVPVGANVSIIAESGTQEYQIQWVVQ